MNLNVTFCQKRVFRANVCVFIGILGSFVGTVFRNNVDADFSGNTFSFYTYFPTYSRACITRRRERFEIDHFRAQVFVYESIVYT